MKKLKKQKITTLLNYQQFLKNNNLKNKIFKSKNMLFENPILYNNLNLESYIIEFNNYENLSLPFTLIKIDKISTIDIKYEKMILFNYNLTYNILYQFNKIMFQINLKKNINLIKGRVLGGNWNNKKILISILGFIFAMKPINLNNALNYKKKNYFNKYNKKNFYKKKINSTRLINCYKIKYLNFQINYNHYLNTKKKNFQDFHIFTKFIKIINFTIIDTKKKSFLSSQINVERFKYFIFMPQFDQFSFFNQVSWFLLFFFFFYFFITYFFLPKICYNLKFRKKKLIFDNNKKKQINFEKNNIFFFMNNFYQNFCYNFELFIIQKKSIYKTNEKFKIQKIPIFNTLLKNKINFFLNQKFLLFKKIFNFI